MATITVGSAFVSDPDEASFDLTDRDNNLDTASYDDWLDEKYDGYDYLNSKWQYVHDHYTLQILDLDKIKDYLCQRQVAEHPDDFAERTEIVACVPYLSSSIDQLNGMVSAVEPDTMREWQDPEDPSRGLGDIEDEDSPAYKLSRNYDGNGMNVVPFWQRAGCEILKYMDIFCAVIGAGENKRDPYVRLIEPWSIINYTEADGVVTDMIVKHTADGRRSIRDKVQTVQMRTHYHLEGWDTYRKTDGGWMLDGSGTYEYYTDATMRQRRLPIFRISLPMSRNVAYQGARQQNRIFNIESEQQMAARKGMIPLLVFREKSPLKQKATDTTTKRGGNRITQDPDIKEQHYFIVHPTEPALMAGTIKQEYVEAMLNTIFREYSDAAQLKTATQIRQESRSSIETILVVLSDTLDEAENTAMFLMEQTWYPGQPDRWGGFQVKRSKTFQAVDADEVIQSIKDRYVGSMTVVPIGREGLVDAVKKIADHDGVSYSDEELEGAVDEMISQAATDRAALEPFNLG